MLATYRNPARAYANVGVETAVASANPHQLIVLLFDGALQLIGEARLHMERHEIAAKGKAISRAIDFLMNGLKASLDMEAGGELAQQLAALYDYMVARLLYANLNNDVAALDEVRRLLTEIGGAWKEIARDPAVLPGNKAAA
jgi:flagellar protein FliS